MKNQIQVTVWGKYSVFIFKQVSFINFRCLMDLQPF